MGSTTRGYPYPASTDQPRVWEDMQDLATAIDADVAALIPGAWTSYTPVWSSSGTAPAIGNGSIIGRYLQIGKTVHMTIKVVFGTTTTFGSGGYLFSLPVAAATTGDRVGGAYLRDTSGTSAGHYNGVCVVSAASPTVLSGFESSTHAQLTPTTPVTWASTDFWDLSITYEAA